MWTEAVDLHSHSTNSDGQHSVEQVAKMMSTSNVRFWSLTDHDTISGWESAFQAAKESKLHLYPESKLLALQESLQAKRS